MTYTVLAQPYSQPQGHQKSKIPSVQFVFSAHKVARIDAKVDKGRMIGYVTSDTQPPAAADLVKAGYTHIIVAFGVFSTKVPGVVVSGFRHVDQLYINSLQAAGIKVLLALGGSGTIIPNTTTNFDQALSLAANTEVFTETFISSLDILRAQYGFDGFDFNIKDGLIGRGDFANPAGDIAVVAHIIRTLRDQYPDMLLTLTPQMENISATQGFDSIWGNYASLVMKTASALNWVGIQLYDSGCCFGIDAVCYGLDNLTSSAVYVAMVTDLLENWPDKDSAGQATGFQPYFSYLNPSQVVLGISLKGTNDANTAGMLASKVKRALQCLRTGDSSCEGYTPPRTYPNIGGVFEWELSYEQANNYLFTQALHACITKGSCG